MTRSGRLCALLGLIGCIGAAMGGSVATAGTVRLNGEAVAYNDGERLASFVPRLLALPNAYWPASRVRNEQSSLAARVLKARVLAQLQVIDAGLPAASELRHELEQFEPFGGLDQTLDPDVIRLHERNNPRLSGDYDLLVPARPDHIRIIGMTRQDGREPIALAPVSARRIDAGKYLDGADREWLYLIDPEGRVRRTGVAAYNARELDVLPGSIVFVPIHARYLDESTRALNDDIVKLLAGGEALAHE